MEFKATKTEKPRSVVLPETAIAGLQTHRERQDGFRRQFGPDYRADLDLVFANPDGTPLKPDSISATVSALFKRLMIPKPKGAALHLLRHTHTSILLAEGVSRPAVSARLGHSSIRTTQEIYAHMIPGEDVDAARKWDEYQHRTKQPGRGGGKVDVQELGHLMRGISADTLIGLPFPITASWGSTESTSRFGTKLRARQQTARDDPDGYRVPSPFLLARPA